MKKDRIRIIGNLSLMILGLALMIYYITCEDACAYLKGSILGVDLKVIGVIFLLTMGSLALLRQWSFLRALLAGSLGVELYLIGFQIQQNVYCPYCLALAALVVAAFIVNYEKPENIRVLSFLGVVRFDWPRPLGPIPLSLFALAGFLFVMLTFSGSVLPVYGAESQDSISTFGKGRDEIRLYTDYLCPPCRSIEPDIENTLIRLVRNGDYRVTFVDMPIHLESMVYATQFLHALNAGGGIAHAVRVRRILFDLAGKGITQEEALLKALKDKGIRTKPYDVHPTLMALNRLIREDQVSGTPTCVIVKAGMKASYVGAGKVKTAIIQLAGPVRVPTK
jgi:uncharacterized membrane protein